MSEGFETKSADAVKNSLQSAKVSRSSRYRQYSTQSSRAICPDERALE